MIKGVKHLLFISDMFKSVDLVSNKFSEFQTLMKLYLVQVISNKSVFDVLGKAMHKIDLTPRRLTLMMDHLSHLHRLLHICPQSLD